MSPSRTRLRGAVAAAFAAALIGVGAQSAAAADWPALREGAYLYSGPTGTGTVTEVDLGDLGTCHTLTTAARSVQIASGSAALELYSGPGCTGAFPWRSGSLTQTNLPWAMLSYRVVPA
ncbi:hypothetical protein SAMN06272735_8830 [Streptomyces sp. TLI_55]|uniref:hypothetical protein n=1 Tax=Streptomyces sp. TLI_55 TaxID=1938861 RepID=UPI000BCF78FA|nr:hypothetical protein [Streptomyces sp. TLI_55]SNX88385.1 hypothetical protein SAMN06272735_8830 [Streptomyces sp. TLI_55]